MARYLVVAHQTAQSQELVDQLKQLLEADRHAEFVLLVPATPVGYLLTWEEGEATQLALHRAQMALGAHGHRLRRRRCAASGRGSFWPGAAHSLVLACHASQDGSAAPIGAPRQSSGARPTAQPSSSPTRRVDDTR